MRKIILGLSLISIGFVSCEKKENTITKSEVNAKVDSIVSAKLQYISTEAIDDLNRREAIEVKPKADSIVQAMTKKQKDTLVHK